MSLFSPRIELKPLADLCHRLGMAFEAGIDARTHLGPRGRAGPGAIPRALGDRQRCRQPRRIADRRLARDGRFFPHPVPRNGRPRRTDRARRQSAGPIVRPLSEPDLPAAEFLVVHHVAARAVDHCRGRCRPADLGPRHDRHRHPPRWTGGRTGTTNLWDIPGRRWRGDLSGRAGGHPRRGVDCSHPAHGVAALPASDHRCRRWPSPGWLGRCT